MSNGSINLLPETMRQRERKEVLKAINKSKVFDINLSAGAKIQPLSPPKISSPKRSLWSEIFGKKIGPAPIVNRPTYNGVRPNLPTPSPKPIFKYPEVPQTSSFNNKPLVNQPALTTKPTHNGTNTLAVKPKKPGLFSQLKYIFAKPKKHQLKEQAWTSAPHKTINKIAPEPPKIEPKPKIKEKYHTVPKAEKSKMDINLIPQELLFKKYQKNPQKITIMIFSLVAAALLIALAYFIINEQEKAVDKKISQLQEDRSKLVAYINGFKDIQQKNIRLQDKLLAINKLLAKHIYWTKFFSLLEQYTLDNIHYTEFTADTSGRFMLPALSAIGAGPNVEEQIADSYRQAAQQIAVFKKADDFVSQVRVNNLEVLSSDKTGVKGVKFEINLVLEDGVFNQETNK